MIWYIAIFLVYLAGIISSSALFYLKARGRVKNLRVNLSILKKEKTDKDNIASELYNSMLGLVDREDLDSYQDRLAALEADLKAEAGRYTIAEAELASVNNRLAELDEVSRELEQSALAASKELEMLRSQERELAGKNEELRTELDSSLMELERLLEQLSDSEAAVQALTKTKTELLSSQEKVIWYQEKISEINLNYMQLKKAYDALDIEYAQLYEKQNA